MVRVLIERWLVLGKEEHFHAAMRQLRREAVHAAGYISGETLRDVTEPLHTVVISTWRSTADWDAWSVSQQREEALTRMAHLLRQPERVTVLEPV